MKQLGGIDATFLYMETPETPMHVAGLTLYELPKSLRGTFYDHFRAFFAGRVHLIPIFEKKLARTMFELDHPGWVDAGELDLDYHIRQAELPPPGTQKQLEALVADLHSAPLDRSRPLWQFTVIEGLTDSRAALYSKVHHAAVDGGAGMVITKALYDLTETPREVAPAPPKPPASRKPTTGERAVMNLNDLVGNAIRHQLNAINAVPQVMNTIAKMLTPQPGATTGAGGVAAVPAMPQLLAPKTPFNVTITSQRAYAARSLSLTEAKLLGKATGAKVNDIVMAICAGALRNYLKKRKALPKQPLIAFVPISLREMGNTDINNQVFGMNCALATDIADPLKRLEAIRSAATESKTLAGGVKDIAPRDFTMIGAPFILPGLMQLYGRTGLADVLPQPVNVVISNTQGPPVPLYCAGAKVLALYPVSIPTHGVALNLTVQSYLDKLDFGLTADRRAVPDIGELAEGLSTAFDELKAAAMAAAGPAQAASKASGKAARA